MYLTVNNASAGSGKTFTLSAEYVADLIAELHATIGAHHIPTYAINAHRRILAITFTNKATAEMKERILQYLYALSQQQDDVFLEKVKEILASSSINVSDQQIADFTRKALIDVLHDYNHFHVITIDSFFQKLLSSLARELNLPANLKVDINNNEAIGEAVDLLLRDPEPSELGWLKNYINQRNADAQNWNIAEEIKKFAYKNLLLEDYQLLPDAEKAFIADNAKMNDFIKSLRKILRDIGEQFNNTLQQIKDEFEASLEEHSNSRSIKPYLKNMPKAPKEAMEKILNGDARLLLKKAQGNAELCSLETNFIEQLNVLEKDRSEYEELSSTVALMLKNLSPLRLLNAIEKKLDIINKEHNRFLLTKTKLLFHTFIDDQDAPFIFEKTGNLYKHILIDEFQDTAKTQWNNICHLLLNSMSEGNTNLIVGDIKQSIYRWNGGDWRLLMNMSKDPKLALIGEIKTETLNDNYRSKSNIVHFNNKFFIEAAKQIDEESNTTLLREIYTKETTHQIPQKGKGGYVYACISEERESPAFSNEETSLSTQMHKLHQAGVAWKDMCILIRKRNDAAKIIENITDIEFVSDEAFALGSSLGVQFIIHLLRILDNEEDTAAIYFAIKTYEEYILQTEPSHSNKLEDLPKDFSSDIDYLRKMPLYELILRLIEIFQLEQLKEGSIYILSLLDQTLDYISNNPHTINSFLRKWENTLQNKSIPSSKVDAVRILTIHKSKGLEFHSVFIPDCTWELDTTNSDHRSFLWWDNPFIRKEDMPHIPITPSSQAKTSKFKTQYEEEMNQRHVDNLNLAYVAFTRPRYNLFLWANTQGKKTKDNMGLLLASTLKALYDTDSRELQNEEAPLTHEQIGSISIYETGTPEGPEIKVTQKVETSDNPFVYTPQEKSIIFKTFPARLSFRQSNDSLEFMTELQGQDTSKFMMMDRGKIFHRIMQETKVVEDMPKAIKHLSKLGIISEGEIGNLQNLFTEYLSAHPEWFDGSWNVFTETTLLKSGNAEHRADRIITRGDETIIIDFKFAQKEEKKHILQVQGYMKLLKEIRPQVKGYLWYVDKGLTIPVEL
ncbi:hypothetical protein HMPREF9332_00094 [Alloprevotella rava F0323]|uniref:DNA 3'-5' helicase n=1 Tax=Alloprevotella rava F0323 TaxID=679199 RepID=G5G944_9BACT|nr:UvrD-helicase domain-containing protein [Alloprevotella rava]EHG24829.1 hypothetical protein HMPREF9332_00094 [Alloprevotella rava F0323]